MKSYSSFKIIIEKKAQKFIDKLTEADKEKVVLKIKDLISSDTKCQKITWV